jgi:hypothetical protein
MGHWKRALILHPFGILTAVEASTGGEPDGRLLPLVDAPRPDLDATFDPDSKRGRQCPPS